MKLVALYKTFDGGEFVDASIASIYEHVSAIVMVHSDVSWLGEWGNTVKTDAIAWCTANDKAGKVHHLNINVGHQEAQYAAGIEYIERHKLGDVIMVVDADEVWEDQYIENAKRQIREQPSPAYRSAMHTYLRSPFYRVDPPYGSPTTFVRNFKLLTESPRACKAPRVHLSDVWMHHYTAVRASREDVARKINQSCLADKNSEQVVPGWMETVYDRLPEGRDLHYFQKHRKVWQRVVKVTMAELPPAMQKAKLLKLWWTPPEPPPPDEHTLVMAEAAKIRDVAKRHAFVFDSGHSVSDFFDVAKRMESEEFALLRKHVKPDQDVIEIGCYTGLNLIGLAKEGHKGMLIGIDFVQGAIDWLRANRGDFQVAGYCEKFSSIHSWINFNVAICFDVLEHQRDAGQFLEGVAATLRPDGTALILVPKGKEYYDCGHVGFFPDCECLRNVLDYVFDVETCYELASCNKLFAVCRKRP